MMNVLGEQFVCIAAHSTFDKPTLIWAEIAVIHGYPAQTGSRWTFTYWPATRSITASSHLRFVKKAETSEIISPQKCEILDFQDYSRHMPLETREAIQLASVAASTIALSFCKTMMPDRRYVLDYRGTVVLFVKRDTDNLLIFCFS